MPEKVSDILMRIVPTGGSSAMAAGGTATIDAATDTLLTGFKTGEYFELDDFSFGMELSDLDSTAQGARDSSHAAGGSFAAWRKPTTPLDQIKKLTYQPDIEPFSFKRRMDRASPVLFQSCANSVPFASAALVKRRMTGQKVALQSFLRLDFTDVLLVGIAWNDGDLVTETVRFICRGLKMQFRRQGSDGTLGPANSFEWKPPIALDGGRS